MKQPSCLLLLATLLSFTISCDESIGLEDPELGSDGFFEGTLSLAETCPNSIDATTSNYHVLNTPQAGDKWWILSRQFADCEGERGIFLFNEATGLMEAKIDLPDDLLSPHGLEYREGSLWLLGMSGDEEEAYQIDPFSGEVLQKWPGLRGEGISVRGDTIFWGWNGTIYLTDRRDSSAISSFHINATTIQDLDVMGSDIYYIINGEQEPVMKLNMISAQIDTIALTDIRSFYSFAIKGEEIYAADYWALKQIRLDGSDTTVSFIPDIDGWITAIRPFGVKE
ncbi:MAG: hypothetical protein AAGA85_20135 [Bacteroidota bacterium]